MNDAAVIASVVTVVALNLSPPGTGIRQTNLMVEGNGRTRSGIGVVEMVKHDAPKRWHCVLGEGERAKQEGEQ